jgi:hypothetical protein
VERRRGKGKQRGRWCVPTLGRANDGEGRARASSTGPIYRPVRLVSQLPAVLIHHVLSWLTSSGHVAIVRAYPCARRSALSATLVARYEGDHGVGVDELTVREERGEEKKGGRRGVLRSRRVTADPRWHRGGASGY